MRGLMELDAPSGLRIGPLAAGGTVSCEVDEPTWRALMALDHETLFHADLLDVLIMLPDLILAGDLTDALTDLVRNGAGLEG